MSEFQILEKVRLKENDLSPLLSKEDIGTISSCFSGSCLVEFDKYPEQKLLFLKHRLEKI